MELFSPAMTLSAPCAALAGFTAPPASDAAALAEHLLAADSATAALLAWCRGRGIGSGEIRATRLAMLETEQPADAVREALDLAPREALRHWRVTLRRGEVPLSDCDLWWLPSRLPADMVGTLEASDLPFDTVIAPLAPRRRTFLETRPPQGRAHVLEHHAIVAMRGGAPIAAVRERYRAVLLRPRPAG